MWYSANARVHFRAVVRERLSHLQEYMDYSACQELSMPAGERKLGWQLCRGCHKNGVIIGHLPRKFHGFLGFS